MRRGGGFGFGGAVGGVSIPNRERDLLRLHLSADQVLIDVSIPNRERDLLRPGRNWST